MSREAVEFMPWRLGVLAFNSSVAAYSETSSIILSVVSAYSFRMS